MTHSQAWGASLLSFLVVEVTLGLTIAECSQCRGLKARAGLITDSAGKHLFLWPLSKISGLPLGTMVQFVN